MTVIEEIAAERRRCIEEKGWTPAHDDEHGDGELALAAAAYAWFAAQEPAERERALDQFKVGISRGQPTLVWLWPETWSDDHFKNHDPRRALVIAAQFIVAEIERLDRMRDARVAQ